MPQKRTPRARVGAAHIHLGRAVRELRARRGLSQEELGHQAELHRNYIGAIERGEINPTFTTLLKLSTGLQVPPSELIRLYERNARGPMFAPHTRAAALQPHRFV